eukprot:12439222-Alexandrium_andersonii.AAC.1
MHVKQLFGTDATGHFKTAASSAYPPRLCKASAACFCASLGSPMQGSPTPSHPPKSTPSYGCG